MRYDDLKEMVTASKPEDWELLGDGPLYMDRLGEVIEDGQRRLEVDTHYYLAVYKPDVSLRIAWGITLDKDLTFDDKWTWPNMSIDRLLVDAF